MCFSATASFSASAVLAGLGTLTLRRVHRPQDRALAAIPALFAVQQAIEGVVWLGLHGTYPGMLVAATQAYSVFSHVLWPIYVPGAVWLAEPPGLRRAGLPWFVLGGLLVGLYLLYAMVASLIVARPVGHHVDYDSPHFYVFAVLVLYLAATAVSPLLSSHRWVRHFGLLMLVSAAAAYLIYARWFISVWCFFAAVLSVVIYLHLHSRANPGAAIDGSGNPRAQST
jgi:hypothetical protein